MESRGGVCRLTEQQEQKFVKAPLDGGSHYLMCHISAQRAAALAQAQPLPRGATSLLRPAPGAGS